MGKDQKSSASPTVEAPESKPTEAAAEPNAFRKNRRGVMIRKELLQQCYKLAAKKQLATGERWSQTRVIESILTEYFSTHK